MCVKFWFIIDKRIKMIYNEMRDNHFEIDFSEEKGLSYA